MRRLVFGISLAACACGGATATPPRRPVVASSERARVLGIKSGKLVPEIDPGAWPARFHNHGAAQYLLGGLRVAIYDDGRVERAAERFGAGVVEVIELPERMGDGYLFYQSGSHDTKLWRADRFTGELKPLAAITRPTDEVVVGFDRLYLRGRYNALVAVDPEDGRLRPLGPLPPAASFGSMAFADGWRAVVDTDLQGPLATFDAGETWRPLPIEAPIRAIHVHGDDPVLYLDEGQVRLDGFGNLQRVAHSTRAVGAEDEDSRVKPPPPPALLGPNPLRVAIERGYPDSDSSVMVAHRGKLFQVSVPDGRILQTVGSAFREEAASCQGIRLGEGFGFVCGVEAGPTVLYAFEAPRRLREVARFAEPRFVAASDNGWVSVRGGCAERLPELAPLPKKKSRDPKEEQQKGGKPSPKKSKDGKTELLEVPAQLEQQELRSYCLLDGRAQRREVAVRGELGSERVVGLRDGRTAVLIPPRPGDNGRVNFISGTTVKQVLLAVPADPPDASKIAERGLWLEGVRETEDGSLAAWVEAGGRVLGVTVKLDGKVELGRLYDRGGQVLFGGRYALAMPASEVGYESTDGGKSWVRFALPRLPESPNDNRSRGCSPAGCALPGWVRVGWAHQEDQGDLRAAPDPVVAAPEPSLAPAIRLTCHLEPPREAPASEPLPPGLVGGPHPGWSKFRGVPPPPLPKGQIGVDNWTNPTLMLMANAHAYVWGPKGADWTRAGFWQLRFDDRFDANNGVHSTARARPPWSDAEQAVAGLGAGSHRGNWNAQVMREPSGDAVLISNCQANRMQCEFFSAAAGQPVVGLQAPQFLRQRSDNAVRIGAAWFFLLPSSSAAGALELWRADATAVSLVTRYRRVAGTRGQGPTPVTLVRRADGAGLGIMIRIPADEASGTTVGSFSVMPIDPDDGRLGQPIALGSATLGGSLRRCEPDEQGWLLEAELSVPTAVTLVDAWGHLADFEFRVRVDPNNRCIDAIAARASGGLTERPQVRFTAPKKTPIPMAASDPNSGSRFALECY
jgi:hypothetical protein